MRELWFAACGRIDLDVRNRAFWLGALGQRVTAEQVEDMHPLRRLEKVPPTPEEVREARDVGWDLFEQGLANLNRERGK